MTVALDLQPSELNLIVEQTKLDALLRIGIGFREVAKAVWSLGQLSTASLSPLSIDRLDQAIDIHDTGIQLQKTKEKRDEREKEIDIEKDKMRGIIPLRIGIPMQHASSNPNTDSSTSSLALARRQYVETDDGYVWFWYTTVRLFCPPKSLLLYFSTILFYCCIYYALTSLPPSAMNSPASSSSTPFSSPCCCCSSDGSSAAGCTPDDG